MNQVPKPQPRFVPTLTEVVDPASLTRTLSAQQPQVQTIVNQVLQQIQPIFERRLQEEMERVVRSMVAKQWSDMSAKLRDELEPFVRQAVLDVLSEQSQIKIQR